MKKLFLIRCFLFVSSFSFVAQYANAQIMQTAEGEKILGCFNVQEGHTFVVIRKTKKTYFTWPANFNVGQDTGNIYSYEGFNNKQKIGVDTRVFDLEANLALPDYLDLSWAFVAPEGTIFSAFGKEQRFYIIKDSAARNPYGLLVRHNRSIGSPDVIRLECSSNLAPVQQALHEVEACFAKK